MAEWSESLRERRILTAGEAFGERLREVRTRRGLSQAQLAARLNELGFPTDRATLAKIEAGGVRARNVKLEEALAIAAALNVSPGWMFAPYREGHLRLHGGTRPHNVGDARRWFAGVWPLADADPVEWARERPPEDVLHEKLQTERKEEQ